MFSCEGITRKYEGTPVVQDITLHVAKGETVGLLGASGVGKTTLFGVLSGLDTPDEGRVMLRGEDITGRAGMLGYMLQRDLLLAFKTIEDNISLPLVLRGAKKKAARAASSGYYDIFGLAGCGKKYPAQLSGGMRQRAALLRTHLAGHDVMLMDEPFSALDPLTKKSLHEWYRVLARELEKTTLLITHDPDEAIALCDRVLVMSGTPGRIVSEFDVRGADKAALKSRILSAL